MRRLAAWFALGCGTVALGVVVGFYTWAPGVVERYREVLSRQQDNTIFYDREGGILGTIEGVEDRHRVGLNRISPYLQKAVVAIEDRRFFAHRGMDPLRLFGAIWADVQAMAFEQGASTITQQLIKLTLLSSERTLTRKIKEIFMALALERAYSKEEILAFYLNQVYLGRGAYGVEKAARAYFRKPASELDWAEATWMAALVKKPEGYFNDAVAREVETGEAGEETEVLYHFPPASRIIQRQRQVLRALGELGWITREQYTAALTAELEIHRPVETVPRAPYFVQQALKEMRELIGVDQISGGGFRVHTTLDPVAQTAAEEELKRFGDARHPDRQAALIALDPRNGEVRALVGGLDFEASQFNRATQARRQPGSAFKPILYAAAFEEGFTPWSVFRDEQIRYVNGQPQGDEEETYAPRNYGDRYGVIRDDGHSVLPLDSRMTLGRALIGSSNVIAVQLLDKLGSLTLRRLARRLGIDIRPRMGLCVALGCSEVTLMELTSAYATFANGGTRTEPVFITLIEDGMGHVQYRHYDEFPPEVISPWTAFQVNKLLQGVVLRGTGRRARLDRPVGGKTGTNDGPRDTWFIGFTPDLVAGVWSGHDDNSIMPFEEGGRSTASAWRGFMERALPPYEGERFPEPYEEYSAVRTCTVSGQVAGEWCPHGETYYYPSHSLPEEVCSVHQGPPIAHATCIDSGELISPHCPESSRQFRYFYANHPPSQMCPVHMPNGWIFGEGLEPPRVDYVAPPQAQGRPPRRPPGRAPSAFAQRLDRAFTSGESTSVSN